MKFSMSGPSAISNFTLIGSEASVFGPNESIFTVRRYASAVVAVVVSVRPN